MRKGLQLPCSWEGFLRVRRPSRSVERLLPFKAASVYVALMSQQPSPLGRYVQLPVSAGMPEAWQGAWQEVRGGGDAKWLTLLEVRPCPPWQLRLATYKHQAGRSCRLDAMAMTAPALLMQ